MPRLSIASMEEAVAARLRLDAERRINWAAAYEQFPSNMGRLLMSRPAYGKPFLELFERLMWDPGPLSRQQREMIAMVASRASRCRY
ncbi:MAG: carboxymuconolactone decarboxylase family protein [Candidatus Binatia bacterium]